MARDLKGGLNDIELQLKDLYQITKNNKFDLKEDYETKIKTAMNCINGMRRLKLL